MTRTDFKLDSIIIIYSQERLWKKFDIGYKKTRQQQQKLSTMVLIMLCYSLKGL